LVSSSKCADNLSSDYMQYHIREITNNIYICLLVFLINLSFPTEIFQHLRGRFNKIALDTSAGETNQLSARAELMHYMTKLHFYMTKHINKIKK
jgi:hypothetical protein